MMLGTYCFRKAFTFGKGYCCFSQSKAVLNLNVELTSERYSHVKRKSYSKVEDSDINYFKNFLGNQAVITDKDDLLAYNTDWLRTCRGYSSVVLHPRTTSHVSKILSHCYERNLAVCPQGGNTSLSGGSVPVFDEIIVSTSKMNKILNIDPISGVLECEAGCVLQVLDTNVAQHNLIMPLDLGAKGSCEIGGNLSTNAGGLRVLRYGSLHNSILGLEFVLPNGKVVSCMSKLKKDNTGYDIKRLLLGAEGTLGIITKASILCPARSSSVNLAFLSCVNFENVLKVLAKSKHELGEILSAIEFMDHSSMDSVVKNLNLSNPVSENEFYIIIETSGSDSEHDKAKLDKFLATILENDIVADGTIASSQDQMQKLWQVRERIAESHLPEGYTYKYDLSVPTTMLYEPVKIMRDYMGSSVIRCCGYGHLGDGNLHMNYDIKAI
ncbi:D-2-hydroxyglutarate dehydrogenase, mitochondrial [Nymphon striatum]|nr:D-2-hydroxyglutarate dehydrogenase, mitochondrial [Nymphon striatum]